MWNYFSKLCKSFLIYHSKIFISPIHGWMTTFLSFLLPMGKCITLMGTQNNIVYSNAPYITLIIGKWSLAHTVESKNFFTFPKNTSNNMGGLYDWIRGIILLYLWKQKSPNIYHYLKSNLLQWKICKHIRTFAYLLWAKCLANWKIACTFEIYFLHVGVSNFLQFETGNLHRISLESNVDKVL